MTNDRRPRLDAMLRAIEDGKYDEELDSILEAIHNRVDHRKQEVLRMVRQVFGEDAKIDENIKQSPSEFMKRTERAEPPDKLNIIKSGEWKPSEHVHTDPAPDLAQHDPDGLISAEKPEETPLTGEIESRSPQFGSIEDKEDSDG